MGYRPISDNSVATLNEQQKAIYDMFYDGDTCKIDGLVIADYHSDSSGANTPGIRINGDTVQVDFTYQNGRSITVTFNPNDPSSLGKSLTVVPGAGGLAEFGVAGNYGRGQLNNYYLDGNANYIAITFGGPYSDENYETASVADKAVTQIEDIISGGNPNVRHVVAGASQGSLNTVDLAGSIFESYGDEDKQPVDIMLLDAKSDQANGKGGCQPFVDYLNEHPTIKQDLIDTGSVIYAYEGNNDITGSPENALAALKSASGDGLHVLMIVNPALNAHGGNNSPEENISNGEVDKIFSGFDIDPSLKELSSGKPENLYYIIDPNEPDGLKKDANGNTIAVTDDQVSTYLDSSREEVRKAFNGLSSLEHIDIKETPFKNVAATSFNNSRTSINYDSVVSNTNFVVDSINKTSFVNNDFDYQYCDSTTSFPESLNEANAYLYSTSGELLKGIANDTKNIEQILLNYAYLDKHLADEAQYLNPENNYGYYTSENIDVNKAQGASDRANMISVFGENLTQGKAGKINLSDLENMVNGSELLGPIGQGLNNEIEDANDLKEKLENLINSTDIDDPAWNIMKDRLMHYEHCCDLRIAAAEILNDAYVKSLNYVIDYMSPYTDLDDSRIPEYTARIDEAIAKIAQLEAANVSLAAVQPTPIYGYTKTGMQVFYGYDYSAVHAAQAQIKANLNTIEDLRVQLEEDTRVLDKLNGLAEALNDANKIVDDALLEIDNLYTSEVSTIDPVFVSPIDVPTVV